MNNFRSEPFQIKDIYLIELQQWERDHIDIKQVERLMTAGMMWTIYLDERILAIVGFFKHWDGVYEVLVYPSIHTSEKPIAYVKQIRRYLNQIAKSMDMRRQQTVSLANEKTDRWMRLLGFVMEGTLVGYTVEGLDCRMWARFPKWQ